MTCSFFSGSRVSDPFPDASSQSGSRNHLVSRKNTAPARSPPRCFQLGQRWMPRLRCPSNHCLMRSFATRTARFLEISLPKRIRTSSTLMELSITDTPPDQNATTLACSLRHRLSPKPFLRISDRNTLHRQVVPSRRIADNSVTTI